jgi:hypothetical protein
MGRKNILGIGILLVVLILAGGLLYYLYTNHEQDNTIDIGDTIILDDSIGENLNFEYEYVGDNRWEYIITGTLPNPCYEIKTEAIVMESFPEQVIVRSTITLPSEDMVCIQVIQEVYEEGEFLASEEAIVRFETK